MKQDSSITQVLLEYFPAPGTTDVPGLVSPGLRQ